MDVYLWTGDDGLFVPGASVTKPHEAAQRLDAQCTCIQCSAVQGDQIGMISDSNLHPAICALLSSEVLK